MTTKVLFDTTNKIIKLCAEGMELEGQGLQAEAGKIFMRAWEEASSDLEKFTSAHYVARHQENATDKLKWDERALQFALKITDPTVKGTYPSLYLNIAKCYEDLNDFNSARKNYELGLSFINALPDDGYGKMIKSGLMSGVERVKDI